MKRRSSTSTRRLVSQQTRTSRGARGRPISVPSLPVSPSMSEQLAFVIKAAKDRAPRFTDAYLAAPSESTKSKQLRDPFYELYIDGHAIAPPLPPERLLQLAEENPVHGACVWVVAIDAAGRGWKWLSEAKEGESFDEDAPKKIDDFLEAITPDFTFTEMLIQAAYELRAIGYSAWEVARLEDGRIGALYPIPSHTIRVTGNPDIWVQLRGGWRRYFRRFGADDIYVHMDHGRTTREPEIEKRANEILLFKNYSPRSPYYGVPHWVNAIPAMAELTAIREFNISWFGSGGQSDHIVTIVAKSIEMAKKAAEDLKTQMESTAGIGHTTAVLHGTEDLKAEAKSLGGETREGHFRLRRGDLIKEILMAHHVPPYRIGWADLGSLGGSAAGEMLEAYNYGSVKPQQLILQDRLAQTLFGPKGMNVTGFKFILNDISLDEISQELEVATKASEAAIVSINEARGRLGFEKKDDEKFDKHYYRGVEVSSTTETTGQLSGVLGELTQALRAALQDQPAGATISVEQIVSQVEEQMASRIDDAAGSEIEQVKVDKRIVDRNGQWCVVSEDGSQTLGCHSTRHEALRQLIAVESNKG